MFKNSNKKLNLDTMAPEKKKETEKKEKTIAK